MKHQYSAMDLKLLLLSVIIMNEVAIGQDTEDPIRFYRAKLLESTCIGNQNCSDIEFSFCFQKVWGTCLPGSDFKHLQDIGNCLRNFTVDGLSTFVRGSDLEKSVTFITSEKQITSLGNLVVFVSNNENHICEEKTGSDRNMTHDKLTIQVTESKYSLLVQFEAVCRDPFCIGLKCDTCGTPPHVSTSVSNITSYKGQNVTMMCSISIKMYPIQEVRWIFTHNGGNNRTINTTSNPEKYVVEFNQTSSSLTINSLSIDDTGNYQCQAENDVGPTKSSFIFLNVTGSDPEVETNTEAISSLYGRNVTIPCNITSAYPEVTKIYWTRIQDKKVNNINSSNPRYNGSTVDFPSLIIYNATQGDNGMYVCHAENIIGRGSSNQTVVTITGAPPIVRISVASWTEYSGNSTTISCSINSPNNSVIRVEWIFINKQGKTTDPIIISGMGPIKYSISGINNASLTIHNLDESDTGTYKCRAENYVASNISNPATLEVVQRPTTTLQTTITTTLKTTISSTRIPTTITQGIAAQTTDVHTPEPQISSQTPFVTQENTYSPYRPVVSTEDPMSSRESRKPTPSSSQWFSPSAVSTKYTNTDVNIAQTPTVHVSSKGPSLLSSTFPPIVTSTVVATPTASNEKSTDDKKIPIIAGAAGGVFVLIIGIVVAIKICRTKKSSAEPKREMQSIPYVEPKQAMPFAEPKHTILYTEPKHEVKTIPYKQPENDFQSFQF